MGATPMDGEGSITVLLGLLKAGDRAAAQPLWDAYFHRLVALARSRLRGTPRGMADEEDVALSAFDSFCRRAERGDFPQLADRDDLWQLLFVLTVRKGIGLARYQARARRGGGRVASLEDLAAWDLDEVLDSEPAPELAAQMADECRRLLEGLGDETLRTVARWRMEGWTNREIAARLGCVEHTVERKLRAIRRLWAAEGGP
jgi:DNA-directed RNA polymerase specialized sigma24 family protein